MQIIPVIDLQQGLVVRGIAGRRAEYRPIVSRLVPGAQPRDIARAFVECFGFSTAYLADLDAIAGSEPDWRSYAAIVETGLSLWIDAGVNNVTRAAQLRATSGVSAIVVGLETLPSVEALSTIIDSVGCDQVIFSLDLEQGRPRTVIDAWRDAPALRIAEASARAGVQRMIVLDLADVGTQQGSSTLALASTIRAQLPRLQLIGGGGVWNQADLQALAAAGYDAALVASALHDGRITPDPVVSPDLP